jgi:hypothetical protein
MKQSEKSNYIYTITSVVLEAAKPKNNECNSSSASFKKYYSTKSSEIILKFENLR